MGAVVWDTTLDSNMPAGATFSEYAKLAHDNIPMPISNQQHHHFIHPGSLYHQLSNLGPTFRHQKTGELVSWTPDCDIRESKTAYHIEIEVPGVRDRKSIQVVWISPRILQIDGVAARPHLKGDRSEVVLGFGLNGIAKDEKIHKEDSGSDSQCQKCADRDNESELTNIVRGERKIGSWRRFFTLPVDCDATTLKAKLDAGLLHISVSKHEGTVAEGAQMVEIE